MEILLLMMEKEMQREQQLVTQMVMYVLQKDTWLLMELSAGEIPLVGPMWRVELMLAASVSETRGSLYPVSRFGTQAELLVLVKRRI
jgi:hypothetical protein